MKQHQVQQPGIEFRPIDQKYFLHEKENMRHDPFADSLEQYFSLFKRRTICHFLLSVFFIGLMIPSIILQAEYIEVDVVEGVGEFEMKDTWDPPISIYMFSRSDDLLIDVQLYLDGKVIEEFTIQERLVIDTRYMIKSENPRVSVRLFLTQGQQLD